MANVGFRQRSRADWGTDELNQLTLEQINTGAVLRIADAVEKVAKRHDELIDDRDYWKRRALESERRLDTERRRTAALRGVVKRKRKADDGK